VQYFDNAVDVITCVNDPTNIVSSVQLIEDKFARVTFTRDVDYVEVMSMTNPIVAAFTTSSARLKLYSVIEKLQDRVLYFDTVSNCDVLSTLRTVAHFLAPLFQDSVIYVKRPGDVYDPPTGDFLGELTCELAGYGPNAYITEFAAGGPKNYGYKVLVPGTGKTYCTAKVRGFTLNHTTSKRLNFKRIQKMVKAFVESGGTSEVVSLIFTQIRRLQGGVITTKDVKKDYRIVYDKRCVLPDGTTIPYGY